MGAKMNISLLPDSTVIDLNELENEYLRKWARLLLNAKDIDTLMQITKNIYWEGYEDGANSAEEEDTD